MSSFFELFYLNNLVTNGDCSRLKRLERGKEQRKATGGDSES